MRSPDRGRPALRPGAWLATLAIVATGLVVRIPVLGAGFNGTDDGWLLTMGRRIAHGEIPYRDFVYAYPPVSIYKEGALIALFGSSYTMLTSRWIFGLESVLCGVVAFWILKRIAPTIPALMLALPTLGFSMLRFYFSNWTFDAELLSLLSLLSLLLAPRGRSYIVLAGVFAGLAALSKQPYLALAVFSAALVMLAPTGGMLPSSRRERVSLLASYELGFVVTLICSVGAIVAIGGGPRFIQDAYLLAFSAAPHSVVFALFQDIPSPSYMVPLFGLAVPVMVACLASNRVRLISPLIAVCLVFLALSVPAGRGQDRFISITLMLTLAGSLAACARIAFGGYLVSRQSRDVEFVIAGMAVVLQYLAQFTFGGASFSYIGCFLSLPISVLFVATSGDGARARTRQLSWGSIAAAAMVSYIVLGTFRFLSTNVFVDAPRQQLTAVFQTPRMGGIRSTPANVAQIDGLVAAAHFYSRPGEKILVLPDIPVLYYLADRDNPTRQDWYIDTMVTPEINADNLARLKADPPRVVFVQSRREYDFVKTSPLLDYGSTRSASVYEYLFANYRQVGVVDDIRILVPPSQ